MTSNIGSQEILDAQLRGLSFEELQSIVMEEVRQHFRPEFLNRVDDMVVFHPLTAEDLAKIVELQLARLKARLEDRRINLEMTQAAISDIASRGYNPVYGARPLKRLIQQDIETPLAKLLVKGELKDGDTATVDYKDGEIVIVSSVRKE